MRYPAKKTSGRSPARTNASGLVARRVPAAWIDSEQGVAFTEVSQRVRDGLPLRPIASGKGGRARGSRGRSGSDEPNGR